MCRYVAIHFFLSTKLRFGLCLFLGGLMYLFDCLSVCQSVSQINSGRYGSMNIHEVFRKAVSTYDKTNWIRSCKR